MLLYSPTAGVVCARVGNHPPVDSPTAHCACVLTPFHVHAWPHHRVSVCVDTAACVCTCPASLQGVCTRTASERVRFMCTALLQRERVCVCMHKYVTALWLCVCLHVCMHKYITARCLCVHTNTASLQRACACVHMRACTSTGLLQGLCLHKHITARCLCVRTHKHSIAARCVCTASLQCVCMLTACAHTCARALCRCTQPPTPPMGADEPQGAPSPAFPPSTPPAAMGIDGSGGSPKVTPRSTRHALLQGAVLPPAPSLPGHPLVWGDVCDTQSPSRACSHLLGICVGAEKTWGANQATVLLAQPGTVRVSWLDGGDTPNGTPVWPPLGRILAFPQHPEPGDGTTWDEHPRILGVLRPVWGSPQAQEGLGASPCPGRDVSRGGALLIRLTGQKAQNYPKTPQKMSLLGHHPDRDVPKYSGSIAQPCVGFFPPKPKFSARFSCLVLQHEPCGSWRRPARWRCRCRQLCCPGKEEAPPSQPSFPVLPVRA